VLEEGTQKRLRKGRGQGGGLPYRHGANLGPKGRSKPEERKYFKREEKRGSAHDHWASKAFKRICGSHFLLRMLVILRLGIDRSKKKGKKVTLRKKTQGKEVRLEVGEWKWYGDCPEFFTSRGTGEHVH